LSNPICTNIYFKINTFFLKKVTIVNKKLFYCIFLMLS
jgi:hypothetical protein